MTSEAFGTRLVPIDFDGNSSTDIFFSRNLFDEMVFVGREFAVWTTGPQGVIGQAVIGDVSSGWSSPVFADSNGNGNTDLWFNRSVPGEGENPATREYAVWTLNGTEVTGQAVIGSTSDDWFISDVADFDGNGSDDLLFSRFVPGEGDNPARFDYAVWTLNGTEVTGQAVIGSTSDDWFISDVADFDGNGSDDLLFSRVVSGEGENPATREYAVWTLNGTEVTGQAIVGSTSDDWFLSGVNDFNGNGSEDLLFSKSVSGGTEFAVWLLNGTEVLEQKVLGTAGEDWSFAGSADFNGNGIADLGFINFGSSELAAWTLGADGSITSQSVVGTYDNVEDLAGWTPSLGTFF